MPRPPLKRSKLNHPKPEKRVAPRSPTSPRVELQQKLVDKPIGHVPSESDDSDKLVTKVRSGRNRRGVQRKEIYASGAVAKGDTPGAHKAKSRKKKAGEQQETSANGGAVSKLGKSPRAEKPNGLSKTVIASPSRLSSQTTANHGQTTSSVASERIAAVDLAFTRSEETPKVETSILGLIKPRRRQPSVLQLIDNPDTPGFGSENGDEDEFLPNDESTPFNVSKGLESPMTLNVSVTQPPLSRKRKLNPTPVNDSASNASGLASKSGPRADAAGTNGLQHEPDLPTTSRTKPSPTAVGRVVTRVDPTDDIMAPPQSSSPLQSPVKEKQLSPIKPKSRRKADAAPVLSTNALQNLMPARRTGRRPRQVRQRSEFDLPEELENGADESDHSLEAESDGQDSSFMAKSMRRKVSRVSKKVGKQSVDQQKITRIGSKGRSKGRGKGHTSTISPLKVTPLKRPLAEAAAKTLQQQTSSPKSRTTYASSRHRHHKGAVNDKENQHVDSSRRFSPRINTEDESFDEQEEREETMSCQQPTEEIKKIQAKFADVDDWQMEFEDVTVDGIGSSSS